MKPTYQTVGGIRVSHTAIAAPTPRLVRGVATLCLLLAGSAFAEEPPAEPSPTEEVAVEEPTESPPPAPLSAADLVELARTRLSIDDGEGARILLLQALDRPGVDADEASYLLGMSWEFDDDPAQALRLYDEGLSRWPGSPYHRDRLYRRAEALAALDQPEEALSALERIDTTDLDEDDLVKLALAQGAFWLDAGRTKKGLRILQDALDGLAADVHPWSQARARAYVARLLATDAAKLHFRVGDRKQARRLEERARLLDALQHQVTDIAELNQPEWVIDGVVTLGGAYEALATDLAESRRPRRLTPEQTAIYDAEVAKRAATVRIKALRTYDLGLDMAERLGMEDARVTALQATRDDLAAILEAP